MAEFGSPCTRSWICTRWSHCVTQDEASSLLSPCELVWFSHQHVNEAEIIAQFCYWENWVSERARALSTTTQPKVVGDRGRTRIQFSTRLKPLASSPPPGKMEVLPTATSGCQKPLVSKSLLFVKVPLFREIPVNGSFGLVFRYCKVVL